MSTSVISAALVGVVLGVGATVAFRPSARGVAPPPSRDERGSRPTTPSPGGAGPPPSLIYGGFTSSELATRYSQPGAIGPISDFLTRTAYTTAYDRRNRIPAWTAEHLTQANLRPPQNLNQSTQAGGQGRGDRQNSTFREDEDVPEALRAKLLDYFRSGYDRGHMVPAADAKISQQAMDETFLLTNIAPQVGEGFNRHYWAYLEAFCRNLTKSFDDVYVFTVPLFLPKRGADGKWRVTYEMIAAPTQPPSIAVPTHFAKVILASRLSPNPPSSLSLVKRGNVDEQGKEWSIGAFVLPNEPIPDETRLEEFIVPVESVESSSGLSLFPSTLKMISRPLCQTVACQVVVRRFDDAQKKVGAGAGAGAAGGGGGGRRRERSATM